MVAAPAVRHEHQDAHQDQKFGLINQIKGVARIWKFTEPLGQLGKEMPERNRQFPR
jgi:hypothetical protein